MDKNHLLSSRDICREDIGIAAIVFRVRCTTEPRGNHGLEGFLLGEEYQAEVDRQNRVSLFTKDLGNEWQFAGRVTHGIARRYFTQAVQPSPNSQNGEL